MFGLKSFKLAIITKNSMNIGLSWLSAESYS